MDRRQIEDTVTAVSEWIRIRQAHGYDAILTQAEAQHSSLLRRLLSGSKALDFPPPRAFSYPWYDLIDIGEGWASPPEAPYLSTWNDDEPGTLIICQSSQWKLIEKKTDKDWIVQCKTNKQFFRCYERDDYEMFGLLQDGNYGPIYCSGWKLERID